MLVPFATKENSYSNLEVGFPDVLPTKQHLKNSIMPHDFEVTQALPKFATANDIREVVRFFRNINSNITMIDFLNSEPRRVFDKRKVEAYIYWGIICLENDFIRLTEFGKELSQKIESEKHFYRQILSSNKIYIAAIRWICQQNSNIINYQKLISFWIENFPEKIVANSDDQERELESIASSFFSLCHAAEFGTLIIGKRGQPSRLKVRYVEIQEFVRSLVEKNEFLETNHRSYGEIPTQQKETKLKVYISCSKSDEISNLIELLEVTDFDSHLTHEFKTENGLSTSICLEAFQECELGLFILNSSHCLRKNGNSTTLRDNILLEINIALALFSQKVVFCWISNETPPFEFQETSLTLIKSEKLDWSTNISILKGLKAIL